MDRSIRVADECWIALATLTRQSPARDAFSAKEILDQVRREGIHPIFRPGIQPHIHLHNVANLPPNTASYRMFYRLMNGGYRLYRPGDPYHVDRNGKTNPRREELPVKYHGLLDWYESTFCSGRSAAPPRPDDPLLRLRGLGKDVWKGIDPDTYVNELRSGWGYQEAVGDTAIDTENVWRKVVRNQGSEFKTVTDLPFTYEVEGASGIWFYRDGKRINRRLGKRELESALKKWPLRGPTDLKEFQDPSYLFGLLTDRRIIGRD